MPTITSTASGLWTAGGTWVGGIAPADGDTVVIAAGHSVEFDDDHSAYTTGIVGITITSHTTTPATLFASETAGDYVLMLGANQKIQGTNATVKGIFQVGTSEAVPYPTDCTFTCILGTSAANSAAHIDNQYLDVKVYCAEPEIRYVQLTSSAIVGATTLNIDQDVTAGSVPWQANDYVVCANAVLTGTRTSDLKQISSLTSSTIVLTAGLTYALPQYSLVGLRTRNVRFFVDSVCSSQKWALNPNGATNTNTHHFFAELSNRTFSGATGTVPIATTGTNGRYSGSVSYTADPIAREGGTRYAIEYILANSGGAGRSYAYYGAVCMCCINASGGFSDGHLTLISNGVMSMGMYGTIEVFCIGGNNAPVGNSVGFMDADSRFEWCEKGIQYYGSGQLTFLGTIANCNYIGVGGRVTLGASARVGSGCTNGIQIESGLWNLNGCRINHATPVTTYKDYGYSFYPTQGVLCRDYADSSDVTQYGAIYAWMSAGKIERDTTPSSPPSALTDAYCHKMIHEGVTQDLTWDIPVVLEAGTPFEADFYLKINSGAYSWTTEPKFLLVSGDYGDASLDGLLATAVDANGDAPDATSTSWQTLYIRYTLPIASNRPIGTKQVAKIRVTARVSSDSGSPYWHWNYTSNAVVNANVQYIEGDDDVAGYLSANAGATIYSNQELP